MSVPFAGTSFYWQASPTSGNSHLTCQTQIQGWLSLAPRPATLLGTKEQFLNKIHKPSLGVALPHSSAFISHYFRVFGFLRYKLACHTTFLQYAAVIAQFNALDCITVLFSSRDSDCRKIQALGFRR